VTATTSSPVVNPYLEGNFAPVTREVTAFDLPVRGRIPSELTGTYVRNGPNPVVPPDPTTYHWFVGDGMVHGIRLEEGRAAWYRNRWVRSPEVAAALGEPAPPSPFGPEVPLFAANTNVIGHAGRWFALVEAGMPPVELTAELATIGPTDLGGTLTHPFSAHPKRDPATGELHVLAYWWGWGNRVRYLVVGTDARVRHQVEVELGGPSMVHDVAVTDRWVVIGDYPCLFSLDAVAAGASVPYRWDPTYQARIGLLPRDGGPGDVRWFGIEPCYVFHYCNAYDGPDGRVVVDVVRHPKMFDTDTRGPNEGPTRLERWVLDPAGGTVTAEVLDDRSCELPRLDERRSGRPYRYGYAMDFGPGAAHGATLRYDLQAGTVEVHDHGPGRVSLEPVFVPRHPTSPEGDGWVLAVVYDRARDGSDLVILAADDLTGEPVAVVELPQRVPFGFHGNWVPDPT
jgi:carotenoid cleavage dioxygenase